MMEYQLKLEVTPTPRQAFTLVELVIVVLITSILAVVAVPRFADSVDRFRAEAGAKRIAADLNLARQNAITKSGVNQGEWVNFYPASDSYELADDADIDHSTAEYWVYFSKTPYPVDLVSAVFTNSNGFTSNSTVKYDMHGTAKSGSPPGAPDAPLVTGEITVASGDEQRTVIINPVTGEASVQ